MSAKSSENGSSVLAPEGVVLPDNAPPHNHGHTAAAWFLVVVCAVGSVLAGLGMPLNSTPLIIAGAVVAVVGVIGSVVLSVAGKGQAHGLKRL